MIKPDLIVTWPKSCDYPLWRQYIRDNRDRFNEIIIIFMETNHGFNYRDFVKETMFPDHCLFVESPIYQPHEDWRNIAVNAGLMHSLHSEWLFFTEQDFFPMEDFWEQIDEASSDNSVGFIGIVEGGKRLHPACMFIKREVLQQTRKFFGIKEGVFDHFGAIQEDIEKMNEETGLHIALLDNSLYKHMAGLSHNMSLLERGEAPNHQVEDFYDYMRGCMKVSVPLHPQFIQLYNTYVGPKITENPSGNSL